MNVTLPTICLRAAACTMPTKDSRAYLNGVHVAPGIAEASDGHVIIRVESAQIEADGEHILMAADVQRLLKSRSFLTIIKDGRHDEAGLVRTCTDQYPDVARILDARTSDTGPGQYDPELLLRVKKASVALGRKHGHFAVTYRGPTDPLIVREYMDGCTLRAAVAPWVVGERP